MTASILQQLLALYFAIIARSFEVVKKKTVSKKNSSIYFTDFTDLDFFYTNIYF